MQKEYDYPIDAILAVENFYKENYHEELLDYEVCLMEPTLVLEIYLEWEGIIGYTHTILSIINAPSTSIE